MCKNLDKDCRITNCRKQYFRNYYLDNKKKYIKEKELRDNNLPKKKRGRPKKVIPPFSITTGEFVVSFN